MSFVTKILFYRFKHTFCRINSLHLNKDKEAILIKGWITNIRKMKKYLFMDVNDGSCSKSLQVVSSKSESNEMSIGSSVEIYGKLGETPKGQMEIVADKINVLGQCDLNDGFPFRPKQTYSAEYIRDFLHLRSKVNSFSSMLRVRHWATKHFHDFMTEQDFIQIHTPIITANDCEGAGEIFSIRPNNDSLLRDMKKEGIPTEDSYFDKKVFLSVSGQLYLEAMSQGLGHTYTFLPAFRAENSKSPLHLSEFYMLEAELAFVSNLYEVTEFLENLIKTVTSRIYDSCEPDINICCNKEKQISSDFILKHKWNTVTYEEAYNILLEHKDMLHTELKPEEGFSKEQELHLVKHFNGPLFVINWPARIKPFYMKLLDNDSTKVSAVDLLMPGIGELAGGSLRENNYSRLKATIPSGLDWYLDLRKYGNVATGGFGLGFERYLQVITGVHNIRDVIPFPRWPHNCNI